MENYEFWATIPPVVLAAIAVATFVTHGQNNLRNELRAELREICTRVGELGIRVSNLEQRVARLEGLFEGLRDMLRRGEASKEEHP